MITRRGMIVGAVGVVALFFAYLWLLVMITERLVA